MAAWRGGGWRRAAAVGGSRLAFPTLGSAAGEHVSLGSALRYCCRGKIAGLPRQTWTCCAVRCRITQRRGRARLFSLLRKVAHAQWLRQKPVAEHHCRHDTLGGVQRLAGRQQSSFRDSSRASCFNIAPRSHGREPTARVGWIANRDMARRPAPPSSLPTCRRPVPSVMRGTASPTFRDDSAESISVGPGAWLVMREVPLGATAASRNYRGGALEVCMHAQLQTGGPLPLRAGRQVQQRRPSGAGPPRLGRSRRRAVSLRGC